MTKKIGSRNNRLESVANIFPQVIEEMPAGAKIKRRYLLHQWPEIVGPALARHTRAVSLEYNRLTVYTDHPSWSNQLFYMKEMIMEKLNRIFHEVIVTEIYFKTRNWLPSQAKLLSAKGEAEEDLGAELRKISISQEVVEAARAECEHLANQELRQGMTKLRLNLHRLKSYREQHKWHLCTTPDCQNLCPPEEELCLLCQRKARQKHREAIRQCLEDMPWARYGDIIKEVDCTEAEFDEQRTILLQNLASQVSYGDTQSLEAQLLVMMYRSLPPEQLTEQVIRHTMNRLRYDVRFKDMRTKEQDEMPARRGQA